jgi:hypothetical protein
MTQYNYRLTIVVPDSFIAQANQLALIMGESASDVNTFGDANWQDSDGNLYSVCSTASKPVVLGVLDAGLPQEFAEHSISADIGLAQKALDAIEVYASGSSASPVKILLAVNGKPLEVLAGMGLTKVDNETT